MPVFAIMLGVLMIAMGGLAVDLMKYEQTRTTIQNTLDRSTLAATSLTQKLDPEYVVRDYFDKAGMEENLKRVTVNEGLNFRAVSAEAVAETNPAFLHMIGIDEFDVDAGSGAEQRITDVEIALVLDVSGSMEGAKIANLIAAAREFVDTVTANDEENRITIAIVPYNAQVNLGPALRGKFQATHIHGKAGVDCLEVPTSTYSTLTMPRNLNMAMSAFADTVSNTTTTTVVNGNTVSANIYIPHDDVSLAKMDAIDSNCKDIPGNLVRLPTSDKEVLKTHISGLFADGNTSIMLGMRWGLTMLDPGARTMFNELIGSGHIANDFTGRPFEWGAKNTMKVVVLMTDGEHVSHVLVKDAYKAGPSDIYRSTGDGNYSIFHSSRAAPNQYWVPHLGTWQATAWNSGAGAPRQNWEHVWQSQRLSWVAYQLYARALGDSTTRSGIYNTWMSNFRGTNSAVSTMNTNLQQTCNLAKNKKIIVYGIAFEAPTNGATQIAACASSPSHYFNANGLQIKTAFRAIASNITQLRLTQ
ncbi:MAG: pilus assembly protein TadG-related protein [Paracoccaceae bacterium]